MNHKLRRTGVVLLITMIFVVNGPAVYGESQNAEEKPVRITELDVSDVEETMYVNDTANLTVTPYPVDADASKITYESSDTSVLTVSSSGKIKAKGAGTAVITVRGDDAEEKVSITVKTKTNKITLNTDYITLRPGEQYQLKAEASPKSASQNFRYASTNRGVVKVNQKGCMTAIGEGYASVIVKNDVLSESVMVIVNQKGETAGVNINRGKKSVDIKNPSDIGQEEEIPSLLTSEILAALARESDNLKLSFDNYELLINGDAIGNTRNLLSTKIPFEKTESGMRFVVNEGKPLPGPFTMTLGEECRSYAYLYLYNEKKEKYQRLQYNPQTGQIEVSQEGTYLLTDIRQESTYVQQWMLWGPALAIFVFVLVYIFVKKKYWFW